MHVFLPSQAPLVHLNVAPAAVILYKYFEAFHMTKYYSDEIQELYIHQKVNSL